MSSDLIFILFAAVKEAAISLASARTELRGCWGQKLQHRLLHVETEPCLGFKRAGSTGTGKGRQKGSRAFGCRGLSRWGSPGVGT